MSNQATQTIPRKNGLVNLPVKQVLPKSSDIIILPFSRMISCALILAVFPSDNSEPYQVSLKNEIGTWKELKKINEWGINNVFDEYELGKTEPFIDSVPYKHRFN